MFRGTAAIKGRHHVRVKATDLLPKRDALSQINIKAAFNNGSERLANGLCGLSDDRFRPLRMNMVRMQCEER